MSIKIQAPPTVQTLRDPSLATTVLPRTSGTGGATAAKGPEAEAKARADADKVGRDFEAILVRQMLTQTKVAGKAGGYADMAVEALSSSISAAGGLGMSRAIADSLTSHAHHPAPAAKRAESIIKTSPTEK